MQTILTKQRNLAKRTTPLNGRETKLIKSFLVNKTKEESSDGKVRCAGCNDEFIESQLIVDHKDNDNLNNDESNLQLLCRKCNYEKNPPKLFKLKGKSLDNLREREREGERENINAFIDKNLKIDSFSVWKNLKSEPAFTKWLDKEMKKKLRMKWKEVVNSGAFIAECSPKTTEVYLNKLASPEGPYKDYTDPDTKEKWLEWKLKYHPYKSKIDKFTK